MNKLPELDENGARKAELGLCNAALYGQYNANSVFCPYGVGRMQNAEWTGYSSTFAMMALLCESGNYV